MSKSYRPADLSDDEDFDNYEFCVSASNSGIEKTSQNLKIKVIPAVGHQAGLNNTKFDTTLTDATKESFDKLVANWHAYKRTPVWVKQVHDFFVVQPNPFLVAMQVYAHCSDYNNPKNNGISYALFGELKNFKLLAQTPSSLLDDNLKMVAFNLSCDKGQSSFFKLIADLYELVASKELFVDKVKEMCGAHNYKDACQIACDLELHDVFGIYEFVVPLFFQDKHTVAEQFLDKAVHLQSLLLSVLDSFVDEDGSSSVANRCGPVIAKHHIPDVRYEKLHNKPLTKLITRLATKYKILDAVIPNVNKKRNRGNLKFLLYKYYVDKTQNESSWEEMVRETVAPNAVDLQLELIDSCTFYNDVKGAAKWAKFYNISFEELPLLVQDYMNNGVEPETDASSPTSGCPNRNTNVETHCLRLADNQIHLVNTKSEFDRMMNDLERQVLIALDSEWKPTQNVLNTAALLQLATHSNIYLIDLIMLRVSDRDWWRLGNNIFNNDNILKLGFAPSTDIAILQKSLPAMGINYNQHTTTGVLDLHDLWRTVVMIENFRFPFKDTSGHQDLSTLVQLCLGKRLDKSNQLSNWTLRPLRRDQIYYAALDAYCLLEIYGVIEMELYKLNINFNQLLNDLLMNRRHRSGGASAAVGSGSSGRWKDKQQNNRRSGGNRNDDYRDNYGRSQTTPEGPHRRPVKTEEVKFVCDGMLEGLARNLRRFGIDTIAVASHEMHDKCVHVARSDNRYILTRGRLYEKLSQHVPLGYCYKVLSNPVHEQLVEVLQHFKINVIEEDVFSRCQLCNSGDFMVLSQVEKRNMLNPSPLHRLVDELTLNEVPAVFKKSFTIKRFDPQRKDELHDLFKDVPLRIAEETEMFYICDGCRKVYWDGKHLDDVLSGKYKNLLHMFE